MNTTRLFWLIPAWLAAGNAAAQWPDNLVIEGVPPIPPALRAEAGRYLEFRAAALHDWHPTRREILIGTRFADTPQLHLVKQPGGARQQLTFLPEPVGRGSFRPKRGDCLVFAQDTGGGEFYQLYRYALVSGRTTLLTDGKSRNVGARWSRSGRLLAYSSTRRTGRDTDLYVQDPADPATDRLLLAMQGAGWSVLDWAPDDRTLLVGEYISANESHLHLLHLDSARLEAITPRDGEKVAWAGGQFSRDGTAIYVATDKDSEFQRLCRLDLATKRLTPLTTSVRGDVEEFELSPDGRTVAFVSNQEGASVLHLHDARSFKPLKTPKLPLGVIGALKWHANSRDLAFNLSSAKSPSDVYSLDLRTGKLDRWTYSESGGLNTESFVEPELVKLRSFDGVEVSGFLYRPDARKFPGPRPVLISIHGGPESQSRPIFQARNNYYLNELGVAVFHPNVRGSSGYGKTFLALDNGFKREDSVKDIGAFLDWLRRDSRCDPDRLAVMGGSYGGYMVLAALIHHGDRLRCGVDVVGISNFLTFLKHTQEYRRDLRRVEYGDERDPAMAEHLARISPTARAAEIRKPLFVAQGLNDPRVPASEAGQIVQAVRGNGGSAWYFLAKDEGHGFQKKRNADLFFLSTVQFLQEFLLK